MQRIVLDILSGKRNISASVRRQYLHLGFRANTYIPNLDGVRALAVLLVVVAHCGLGHVVPGGFGVTVFFFLSGYLITTLLVGEGVDSGFIDVSKFYIRRIYRLLPVLYIVISVNVILGQLGVFDHTMRLEGVLAQYLHLTNYWMIFEGKGVAPNTGVLWSLAVEEHFYLFFPVLMLAMLLAMPSRFHGVFLLFLCLLILVWRVYLVYWEQVSVGYTYKATDTRIDSILYGCVFALMFNPVTCPDRNQVQSRWLHWVLFIGGALLLLFCFLYRSSDFRESWRYSLQGVALMPIFFCAVRYSQKALFSWLEHSAVKYIGKISYSIYLIHPLCLSIVAGALGESVLTAVFFGVPLSVALAAILYHAVERRFSNVREKYRPKRA